MKFTLIRKVIKPIICLISIFVIFFLGFILGQKHLKVDHFAAASNMNLKINNESILATGEMAALNFEPGFKQRVINFECQKQSEMPICAWAELSVFNSKNIGLVSLEIFQTSNILEWSPKKFKAVMNYKDGEKIIEIDSAKRSMVEVLHLKSGDIRTTKLVGTFDKLGSYFTSRK